MDYTFKTVGDIRVSQGGARRLDRLIPTKGGERRISLVTDKDIVSLGLLDPGLSALGDAGHQVDVIDTITADPPEHIIMDAVDRAKAFRTDYVIGFGGGSPMDAAKVIACLAANEGRSLASIYGVNNAPESRLSLCLVPTTAGTGSEVTNIAIVTTGLTTKEGIVADTLFADLVLLDAELTTGLPRQVTAATGIDAMVHAIEAYTSLHRKNPISDMLALAAFKRLRCAIIPACNEPDNIGAREQMLLGATLAGQAFANAPVAAVHALAYPLGGRHHITHGLSNALVLTEVLRFNAIKAEPLYAEIANAIDVGATSDALIADLERIMRETDVPRTLGAVGVPSSSIPELAQDAMKQTRLLQNNPRPMTLEDCEAIYQAIS